MFSQCLRRIRLCTIFVLLVCSQLTTVHSAVAKSLAWKVSSPTAIVYLLGSIHVGVPSMYPLPKRVEDAYNKADYLVVEVNANSMNKPEFQQRMLEGGFYPGTQTLQDHVDGRLYRQLTSFLVRQGIPEQPFVKMKPGMLAITLSMVYMQQLGYSPGLGVDMHFMNEANLQHKPILELETAQAQMDLLLSFSDDALLLKQTLSQLGSMKEMTTGMVTSWKTGDADALNKLIIEDPLQKNPEFLPFTKKLIFDRNVTMAKKIQAYLSGEGTYFVIVGAGHLVGNKGIISLLREAGFDSVQF